MSDQGSSMNLNQEKLLPIKQEDEIVIELNFQNLIFLELNKFIHFFNENFSHYCHRLNKIRVKIIIIFNRTNYDTSKRRKNLSVKRKN